MALKAKSEATMQDFERLVETADGDPERLRRLIAIADTILARRVSRRGIKNRPPRR